MVHERKMEVRFRCGSPRSDPSGLVTLLYTYRVTLSRHICLSPVVLHNAFPCQVCPLSNPIDPKHKISVFGCVAITFSQVVFRSRISRYVYYFRGGVSHRFTSFLFILVNSNNSGAGAGNDDKIFGFDTGFRCQIAQTGLKLVKDGIIQAQQKTLFVKYQSA